MKKNWLIGSVLIIVCVLSTVITIIFKNKFNEQTNDPKETLVANSGTKIMKTKGDSYISYIVEDYERNLTYTWSFPNDDLNTSSLKDDLYIDLNLRLSIDAITNNTKKINDIVDQNKLIVTFDHHGQLPQTATVRINVQDKFADHEKLYLYYYNADDQKIEYVDKGLTVKDGYVEFQIDHCSDYFLTATIVQEAINNPKNINYIIIILGIIVILLIAITLKQNSKGNKK